MFDLSLAVCGGDQRQTWLAQTLQQHNALSAVYAVPDYIAPSHVTMLNDPTELCRYTCVVGPVPLARQGNVTMPADAKPLPLKLLLQLLQPGQLLVGGNLSPALLAQCAQRQIATYDLLQSPTVALSNAAITAEGMVAILLQQTPYVLQHAPVLLVGYGRCGMLLAQKLAALDGIVTVCDCDPQKRQLASAFGFSTVTPDDLPSVLPACPLIVNTAPAMVLTDQQLSHLPQDAMLFELASAPGGIDASAARKRKLFYQNCPGLPGRTAPQTAGTILAQDLLHYLTTVSTHRKDDTDDRQSL